MVNSAYTMYKNTKMIDRSFSDVEKIVLVEK